ncbi:hypothetical protein V2P20_10620 [Methylobacter sp. Wu1]|jgi:hypothetical protein|uniref:hypothetical protein n=1 Tax=Methylobacter sp. Wu1 TaxID=3119359 RepID=UPI002F948CFF
MNSYEQSKKARYIASVVYVSIMAFILGGTYISQQEKEKAKQASTHEASSAVAETQAE